MNTLYQSYYVFAVIPSIMRLIYMIIGYIYFSFSSSIFVSCSHWWNVYYRIIPLLLQNTQLYNDTTTTITQKTERCLRYRWWYWSVCWHNHDCLRQWPTMGCYRKYLHNKIREMGICFIQIYCVASPWRYWQPSFHSRGWTTRLVSAFYLLLTLPTQP